MPEFKWTNESVLLFAEGSDPIDAIETKARDVALTAIDKGWQGPPFDPIKLADLLKISVGPRDDVPDARTVAQGQNNFLIEFNPSKSRGRVRFSIAHEIAHTFFPDCNKRIRNRESRISRDDNWQLEMLCNLGAAEIVMPVSGMPELSEKLISIDLLIELQRRFDVSMEALLIRATKLSEDCFIFFTASRVNEDNESYRYRVDYSIPSKSWSNKVPLGMTLPADSAVSECSAIGYTSKSIEDWPNIGKSLRIECIGLPAYPGSQFPRVVGIARDDRSSVSESDGRIEYLRGSALEPIGAGPRVVAHIVNDKTANWGGHGFAAQVKKTWPEHHREFREWSLINPDNLSLGMSNDVQIDDKTFLFNMVAQHGFGASDRPRIRYSALEACLRSLSEYSSLKQASVHMPRIGTGHAGGDWGVIEELIVENVLRTGVAVFVYDLPSRDYGSRPFGFDFIENQQAKR